MITGEVFPSRRRVTETKSLSCNGMADFDPSPAGGSVSHTAACGPVETDAQELVRWDVACVLCHRNPAVEAIEAFVPFAGGAAPYPAHLFARPYPTGFLR